MMRDPSEYFTLPLEAWTFCELSDALGAELTAQTLGIQRGNVRVLRHRRGTSVARMQQLHEAFRNDESGFRARMVTLQTGLAARRPKPTKESTHA